MPPLRRLVQPSPFKIFLLGFHRSLGVHITLVRSINLDKWQPGQLEIFKHMNNAASNAYWEAKLPSNYAKPAGNASDYEVRKFIKDKYVLRVYVDPDEDDPVTAYHNGKDSKKSKKKKPKRKRKDTEESEESEPEEAPAPPKKKTTTVKQPPVAQNRAPAASKKRGGAAVADMISFKGEDDFSEFMDGGTANPAASGSNLIGFEQ